MPNTYYKIASVTVGSGGASSIAFSSIPSTYTDLCLKVSGRSDYASGGNTFTAMRLAFNGGSVLTSDLTLYGTGSATASGNLGGSIGWVTNAVGTSSTFSSNDFYIPNYAGSTFKSLSLDSVTENNATQALAVLTAALWSNTSAITSIALTLANGNFVQYSTATLYGIKNS